MKKITASKTSYIYEIINWKYFEKPFCLEILTIFKVLAKPTREPCSFRTFSSITLELPGFFKVLHIYQALELAFASAKCELPIISSSDVLMTYNFLGGTRKHFLEGKKKFSCPPKKI